MAYITAEIKIQQVALSIQSHLYFPTDLPDAVGNKVKGVITLLHGMGNGSEDWMRFSAACRYAADNGYVLVAPSAQNSFYLDMASGPPWDTVLTQLYPEQLRRIFKLPTERSMNYIAGLSMGGYGAMRIGLSHPDRYAAIGSFSGALDMRHMAAGVRRVPLYMPMFTPVLGPDLAVPDEADVLRLAQKVAALPAAQRPRIYCSVGKQDEDDVQVYTQNQNFRRVAEGLDLDFHYAEWDGVHEWNFWDRSLAEFIGFIQNSDYGARKRADWAAPEGG